MEDQILDYVKQKGTVTAGELLDNLDISRSALFRSLDELVSEGKLIKIGNRPNVIYKLPEPIQPTPAQSPTKPSETQTPALESDNSPPDEAASYPSPVIYWCKILKLDPEAVRVSFKQIRQLVPNYQSIGLNPPKVKRGGLKVPDPIWIRFFNMLVWILAMYWTMVKRCYAIIRGRSEDPIVWRQMAIVIVSVMLILKMVLRSLVNPLADPQYIALQNNYEALRDQLESVTRERDYAKNRLESYKESVQNSPTTEQMNNLKFNLEREEKLRKDLEIKQKEWSEKQSVLIEEQEKRERAERRLEQAQEDLDIRLQEWQKKERNYQKKLENSQIEIRELEDELSKSTQQLRQLTRQLKSGQMEQ